VAENKGTSKPARSLRGRCQESSFKRDRSPHPNQRTETTRQSPHGSSPCLRSGNRESEPRPGLGRPIDSRANRPMQKGCQGALKSSLSPRAVSSRVSQQTPGGRPNTVLGGPLGSASLALCRGVAIDRVAPAPSSGHSVPTTMRPEGEFLPLSAPCSSPNLPGDKKPLREAAHAGRSRKSIASAIGRIRSAGLPQFGSVAYLKLARLPRICARRSARPIIRSRSRQRFQAALVRQCGPDLFTLRR
jgi:hypothetical protein